MATLHGNDIVSVPLAEAINRTRLVDQDLVQVAQGLREKTGQGEKPAESVEAQPAASSKR